MLWKGECLPQINTILGKLNLARTQVKETANHIIHAKSVAIIIKLLVV